MCGRATLTKTNKEIEERLQAKFVFPEEMIRERLPNFNVAPTHVHPIVTNTEPGAIQFFRWGLIPFWAKDEKIGYKLINARIETVLEKPSFRGIKYRRCLVPFDGFYEWRREGKEKFPYRIQLSTQGIFNVAGIWESWRHPQTDVTIFSFTLLTQPPNELVAPIHNRMPAILLSEQEQLWLSDEIPMKELVEMIQPYPEEEMMAYAVSQRVNKVSENDASLVEPV